MFLRLDSLAQSIQFRHARDKVIQNPLPPLARSALDRDYLLRANPEIFTVLGSQSTSMALLMHQGKVLLNQDSALSLVPFSSAPKSGVVVYLGKTLEASSFCPAGSGICLVVLDKAQADAIEPDSSKWISLRPSGPAKYNAAILLELPRFQPIEYEITLDNHSVKTEAMLIAVGNGSSYGGGMKVCAEANLHDGLFDVVILRPVSKFEFLKVFPKVYSGSHLSHPAIDIYRSRTVVLNSSATAYADGERIGQLPVRAECVKDAALVWSL